MLDLASREPTKSPSTPRRPHARELPALHQWLDRGLRRGEEGRLAAEYPLTMGVAGSRRHQVSYRGQQPVAHAMSHVATLRARGRLVRLGMIGNVFTDPAFRNRGLAARCVEAAVEELRGLRASLAVLWGEQTGLYQRAGFLPTGLEHFWNLTTRRDPGDAGELRVRPLRSTDLTALETLYAAKPVRIERRRGAFRAMCSAPETHVAVAQRGSQVAGYAVAGRGDDFAGVVHEWAGSPEAVAQCVDWLREHAGAHTVMSSPVAEGFESLLAASGATSQKGIFALVLILDVEELWRAIAPRRSPLRFARQRSGVALRGSAGGPVNLSDAQALELFFGSGPSALPELARSERRELSRVLPWPLYIWGLDSI